MAHPTQFHPELTDARLSVIAECLLNVLFDTELELTSPLDDAYTRGATTFGRRRNAVIQLCQTGSHDWLKLTHAGMDVTFEIGGVPCRFFADDPASPKKPGYFRRNASDQLFAVEESEPVVFRFVVDKPDSDDQDVEAYFIGYDAGGNEAFRWQHSRSAPVLVSVDPSLPPEVPMQPVQVRPRTQQPSLEKASGDDEHQD